MRILFTGDHDEDVRRGVREAAPRASVAFGADLAEGIEEADAVVGHVPDALLARARRLRWVHSPAAGVDGVLSGALLDSDVTLTSSAGNGAIPLAEHAMLLMLMLSRDVPRWQRAQAERRWDRHTHGELAGATVGLYGLGNAGLDLAAKAKAFHMRVLGMRRRTGVPALGVDELFGQDAFHRFLAACDFVVVTAPLTPATSGRFDRAAFAAMKRTACFVCVSRGGIADDDALLDAVRRGEIAGAGLDAHGVEPLPPRSPFWTLPNVIVTPHNGATTRETARRGVRIMLDNVGRFARGEPLRNVVDKAAGY
ncbi:D-2-hydroxyacid dehydrogenase [Nonomuraea sp. KC401]|uniref:D-2-hydroxyacid dehydrogenase n=1 Tax=unclassified Nonomuraea TaxID=2593643 RepID=UPI0010FF545B|nr:MULTISPECIES: D-2-hydroxyacid dehydrogenase [unclassified Nonomuraea]NBE99389.1 D-2-hydroxyacid dehydrogenase [Nonomuraea sp. K271]TLF71473.1 D-2-hydroxyacid dehydrogenase [Nonomuraea sp. KC401]